MEIKLFFDHNINESLQWGDDVYFCRHQPHGQFDTVDNENLPNTGIVRIGKCVEINRDVDLDFNFIIISIDPSFSASLQSTISSEIGVLDFIMFSKDNKANLSSLLGYYAETTFLNDSPYEAELFATSTEFSESSK